MQTFSRISRSFRPLNLLNLELKIRVFGFAERDTIQVSLLSFLRLLQLSNDKVVAASSLFLSIFKLVADGTKLITVTSSLAPRA